MTKGPDGIAENGLRGGVLLPTVAPDVKWVKPLYDPVHDPIWAHIQDLDIPLNLHSGTGSPGYGKYAATPMLLISEVGFYGYRALSHFILSGVFERFPRLEFVLTEGTPPFTREHLRQVFPGWDVPELRRVLGENAAKLYGFDMGALEPYAAQWGPTVEEIGTPLTELPADPNASLLNSAAELARV